MVAEVVTGEAVVLEVPCARFPSRLLAVAIDLIIQVITLFTLFVIVAVASRGGGLNPASAAAVAVAALVTVVVGYPVVWETLSRGRSPGKFAMGLRVVSDDGGPEQFRQALVRGLAGAVEIWALAGCPALICSLLSERGKRLGDVFAGTFVIQQRLPTRRGTAPPAMIPQLAAWAAGLDMSGLTGQTAEMASRYLARVSELAPQARTELGARIAGAVSAQVSPPPPGGTPVASYLGAVLAERRRRAETRLASPGPVPGSHAASSAPAPPGSASSAPAPPGPGSAGPSVRPVVPPPDPTGARRGAVGRAWVRAPWEEEEEPPPERAPRTGRPSGPGESRPSGPGESPGGFVPPA